MTLGIGFGAERLGLVALRFPRIALVCGLALLMLIAGSLPRLSFDDDIHRVFLSDSALSQAQRTYDAGQSPPQTTLQILAQSAQTLSPGEMSVLRDLALELEFLDGVMTVASPFALRWPSTPDAPSGVPVFPREIPQDYSDVLSGFAALETGLPLLVNADRTALLISVTLDLDQTTTLLAITQIGALVVQVEAAGLRVGITGEDAISAEIVSGLKDDLIALNLWGALIVTLAAFALLRDMRMALLAVVPAALGALGVLAMSVWLDYPITVLSNVIPILLLVLGVADGVHLAGHMKEHRSVSAAVREVGPACALTALTTALAFASIALTGNAQLFEFAVLGALGTLMSFGVVIVTFALMGREMTLSPRPVPSLTATGAVHLARLGGLRPAFTVLVCVVLLGASIVGFTQTKAWFPLYQNLPDSSATRTTNDHIAAEFGGVFQLIVEHEGPWPELVQLTRSLEAQSGAGHVLSEVTLARWLGTPHARPTEDQLATVPDTLRNQLRGANGNARAFVAVPEPMRSEAALAHFDMLNAAAVTEGADRVLGLPTIMRHEAVVLIDQLSIGLAVAAAGSTVMVAVAFGALRLVPLLIVPNLLPLMLTGASLHVWAGGKLTPTAVLALTIAFGIAIDDTVHFLSRYYRARAQGVSVENATELAARTAGQVMVLTTLLLTCGLAVTLLSDFQPIRLFGGMMILTLWAALLIDLLLLPALLRWKRTAHAFS